MGLYEHLGREADRATTLATEYRKLLVFLAGVQTGAYKPDGITVDLLNETWSYKDPELPGPGDVILARPSV